MDVRAELEALSESVRNVEQMYWSVQSMLVAQRDEQKSLCEDSDDEIDRSSSEHSAAASLLESPPIHPAAAGAVEPPVLHGRRRGQRPRGAAPSQYEQFLAQNFSNGSGPPKPRPGEYFQAQDVNASSPKNAVSSQVSRVRRRRRRQPRAKSAAVDLTAQVAKARDIISQTRCVPRKHARPLH